MQYLIPDSLGTIRVLAFELFLFPLLLLLILTDSTSLPVEWEVLLEGQSKDDSESEPEEA